MPTIKFTYALKRFFPQLKETPAKGKDLSALLDDLNGHYPGIKEYVVDERGSLRKHVNIFIDGELIKDRQKLSDAFRDDSEVYIMQALSGG
ncbi:MAG TPA: molybdenum cofactor biosynthesis protein MoaD [Bacteroidetes bacterium]|nr:molybdenum cofactor biosynthesis protein MoaD [Bacteroidota bacterium]